MFAKLKEKKTIDLSDTDEDDPPEVIMVRGSSSSADGPQSAASLMKKRSMERWEPESFKRLCDLRGSLNFIKDIEPEAINMCKLKVQIVEETNRLISLN